MLFWMSIVEALSIVVLGFLGVHFFGMLGVAWAIVLGFLLEKIMMIVFLEKKYGIRFQDYTNVPVYTIYCFVLLMAYGVNVWFF